jgi:hypothetical protein
VTIRAKAVGVISPASWRGSVVRGRTEGLLHLRLVAAGLGKNRGKLAWLNQGYYLLSAIERAGERERGFWRNLLS